jgi:hypothetical protein
MWRTLFDVCNSWMMIIIEYLWWIESCRIVVRENLLFEDTSISVTENKNMIKKNNYVNGNFIVFRVCLDLIFYVVCYYFQYYLNRFCI